MIREYEMPKAVAHMLEKAKKRKENPYCDHPLSNEQKKMIQAWKARRASKVCPAA